MTKKSTSPISIETPSVSDVEHALAVLKAAGVSMNPKEDISWMDEEDSMYGRIQRLDRSIQIEAFAKLARMVSPKRLAHLMWTFAFEVARELGHEDAEALISVATKKRNS